ncbi:leucine-rich repeat and IQ domain-containing protein 3 isoform X2 [Amia ocellicauda]|uniref:leucine-rich repeat and IQ domain-containing protein 3 isoform X2 n=1 Tax=Amia ocellicauda TaxID=2972642 RepID=UPI0034645F38
MSQLGAEELLVSCSGSLALRHGRAVCQGDPPAELRDVVLLTLGALRLKNVQNLDYCTALQICILANNYITKIDALISCHCLVRLDLHRNQITQLPGSVFWAAMKNLQILNLHDNCIGNKKDMEGLSGCPHLIALTLFDTPLSLTLGYRHCIVNSIWSLKALDNFVVSDEEIIEGWSLPRKFTTKSPHLFVDLCPRSKKESFEGEMKIVREVVSKINTILAFYSPMTIIQRWIRGHLTRKRLGPQIFRPKYHCSHIYSASSGQWSEGQKETRRNSCAIQQQNSEERDLKIMHLTLDLTKLLKSEALQALQCDTSQVSSAQRGKVHFSPLYNTPYQSKSQKDKKRKNSALNRDVSPSKEVMEEELEKVHFRLLGFKAVFHHVDPVSVMLMSRKESAKDIRQAIDDFHSAKQEAEKPKIPYLPPVSAEKRLIAKAHGSISLAPFQVIEKAYRERQKAENMAKKIDFVTQVHANRVEVQNHVEGHIEVRKYGALQRREKDDMERRSALEQQRLSQTKFIESARKRYARFAEKKKRQAAEHALVKDFSSQHISLSKTMARHSTQVRQCAIQQEKSDLVVSCKEQAEKQKQVNRAYIEHRTLALQAEGIAKREAVDSFLADEANKRLLEARARVSSLKSQHATMEAMRPVPVDQTPQKVKA